MSRPTSFYYAFLSLSRPQREAIVAVWDFCRAVDDTVDEAQGDAQPARVREGLQAWRREIAACFAGQPSTREGRALLPWIDRFHLSRQPLEDLVDGVEMDLDRRRYSTFQELYEYCWRVASTVGFVCLDIFGVRDAREYALNLGVALQLTNILRDVKTDFAAGRIYLPLEDLARFGCAEAALGGDAVTPPLGDLLRFEAARAREYYARAAAARPPGAGHRLVAAEIMGAIYGNLLESIAARDYDVLSERAHVTRPRQAAIALSTWLRSRFSRRVHA